MNWKATDFTEHPEGGRFREVYRSPETVQRPGKPDRTACTHIYFELRGGEVSRFHKVEQEEIWNLYDGALHLWIYDESTGHLDQRELSSATREFCAVVPAGCWQAAEPVAEEALVGCTVSPGFDFEDFELISPEHAAHAELTALGLDRLL
jgi:predicted cupin superfamily sugar epimerase